MMIRSLNHALLAGVSISALLVYSGIARAADVATVSVNGTTYSNSGQSVSGATSSDGAAGSTANVGAAIMATGSNSTINITGGTITGGHGGAGGDADPGANNGGDGGDASAIYVPLGKTGASISVSQGATVTGGTGGNGGAAGGAGGTAGQNGTAYGVDIRAANATLINSGIIQAGTSGTTGSTANGGNEGPFFSSGAVGISGEGAATGASITNTSTGQILGNGGYGIAIGASNATVTNYGAISTTNGNRAIYVTGATGATTIDNYGSITGGSGQKSPTETNSGNGIMIESDVSGSVAITNRGTITGGDGGTTYGPGTAIDIQSSGGITVNNYGTINSGALGTSGVPRIALTFDMAQAAATFNNYSGGTLNGGIGTSTHGDQINFYGGTLNGSIYGMATSGGALNGTGADVYFRSGTTTVNGDIGKAFGTSVTVQGQTAYWGPVRSFTLSNGATLAFGQDTEIHAGASSIINGGTFDLGTSKITYNHYDAMNVPESFSGTLYFKTTINANTGKHGYWIFTKASGPVDTTMFSDGVPTFSPTVVGSVATGAKYILIQDTDGRTVVNLPSVVNSGGVRWTVSSVTGAGQTDTDGVSYGTGTTNILLTAAGANTAATTTVANSHGLTTLATYSGSNAAMTSLSNAVNNLTNTADIEKAAAQLRPSTNGSTTQAALGAVGQAINTISIRTDSVRAATADSGIGSSGVSSGESLRGLGVWTQGFGSTATQDKRLGVDGYSADTYGIAFGADVKVVDPVRVGLSFAYARTNVDDAGSREGSGQAINSYIGSLYGTYAANRWYVDGAVTYGKHDYSGTRVIAITGAATQIAKSSYSGEQYGARAELGVPVPVGPATVTPLLSLAYNHLNQDAYTETGAAAALSVGASATDSIKSGLGAKVSATVAQWGEWNIKPNARAIWNHEFNASSHDQTSTYVDGGASFTNASSEIAAESFNLGVGLDLASVRNITVSGKYDAGLSDRYVSHTGSLQARLEF